MNLNTFDRIVSYFHALACEPFEYQGKKYEPYKKLVISPSVFNSYKCPNNCGACCKPVSLVWETPPASVDPAQLKTEILTIGGPGSRELSMQVFHQPKGLSFCQYLSANGRCGIYDTRPLPCRFELFKFAHRVDGSAVYARIAKPGRAWALTKVTGEKGAGCNIVEVYDEELMKSNIDCLQTIGRWMAHFGIFNDASVVVQYLEAGPTKQPLVIERG